MSPDLLLAIAVNIVGGAGLIANTIAFMACCAVEMRGRRGHHGVKVVGGGSLTIQPLLAMDALNISICFVLHSLPAYLGLSEAGRAVLWTALLAYRRAVHGGTAWWACLTVAGVKGAWSAAALVCMACVTTLCARYAFPPPTLQPPFADLYDLTPPLAPSPSQASTNHVIHTWAGSSHGDPSPRLNVSFAPTPPYPRVTPLPTTSSDVQSSTSLGYGGVQINLVSGEVLRETWRKTLHPATTTIRDTTTTPPATPTDIPLTPPPTPHGTAWDLEALLVYCVPCTLTSLFLAFGRVSAVEGSGGGHLVPGRLTAGAVHVCLGAPGAVVSAVACVVKGQQRLDALTLLSGPVSLGVDLISATRWLQLWACLGFRRAVRDLLTSGRKDHRGSDEPPTSGMMRDVTTTTLISNSL